jgi:hypothetical protein
VLFRSEDFEEIPDLYCTLWIHYEFHALFEYVKLGLGKDREKSAQKEEGQYLFHEG